MSTSPWTAGRRFAYASSAARNASSPCSGRTAAPSNSGSPTGAFSTATDARHASRVSSGNGDPVARIAAPPTGCSTITTSGASSSSTSRASCATSGPIPSPGRRTTVPPLLLGKRVLPEQPRLGAARGGGPRGRGGKPGASIAAFQLPKTRATVWRDGWFSPAWSHSLVNGVRLCLRYQSVIAYTIVSGVQRNPVLGPVLMLLHLLLLAGGDFPLHRVPRPWGRGGGRRARASSARPPKRGGRR